ncbi:MAG: hypothetical protein M1817_004994 [Caeruleum heppii]|nr:MAG: hypothetical protein M1817_004994 [Caeruleum heppii]
MRLHYALAIAAASLASALPAEPEPAAAPAAGPDAAASTFAGIDNTANPATAGEAAHRRHVFHIGGQQVQANNGTIVVNQLYVEQLIPAAGVKQTNPLIFFHGGGFSGTTWLNTPDNRKGFASYFLDKGYAVYLVDVTTVGRSPRQPNVAMVSTATAQGAEAGFSAVERYNAYPQAILHTQWPGTGLVGDPVFDGWYRSFIQVPSNFAETEVAMGAAGCELLRRIGRPSFLVPHSYGGIMAWKIADQCPDRVQGYVGIEPDTAPFTNYIRGFPQRIPTRPWGLTNSRLTYDPPVNDPSELIQVTVGEDTAANRSCQLQAAPARQLPNLAKVPFYMYTAQASIYMTFAHCIPAFLRQAGVRDITWQLLQDLNIKGNAHFSFIEKNNLDIAAVVYTWLQSKASRGRA